jgi:hypothetical protein
MEETRVRSENSILLQYHYKVTFLLIALSAFYKDVALVKVQISVIVQILPIITKTFPRFKARYMVPGQSRTLRCSQVAS